MGIDSRVLTLSKALKLGKLQDFIAQEEARGVPPTSRIEFVQVMTKIAKSE